MGLKIYNFFKKYWYFIVIAFVLAFSVANRVEMYALNRQLWHDEAQLAANFFKHSGFLWAFGGLNYGQIAPPLFLFTVKILTVFFGCGEFALGFIPFLFAMVSVPVFYFLSKKILKTKPAIILANTLFAINFILIRFGCEFKQYSGDILIYMLVLMWLDKADFKNPSGLDILKYGAIFTLLFFVSQPSIFLLAGFVLYNIFAPGEKENFSGQVFSILKIASVLIIPALCAFIYKNSLPSDLMNFMNDYWNNEVFGFISFNNLPGFLMGNYSFFTTGSKYMTYFIPFIVAGCFIFAYKKSKIAKVFLYSVLGGLLAGFLHIYPYTSKMILFLLPFFIIFIALCFDFEFSNKRLQRLFAGFVVVFSIVLLLLFQFKIFCKNRINTVQNYSAAGQLMLVLKENFNQNEDILIVPERSFGTFVYYSNLYNFNAAKLATEADITKIHKDKGYIWIYAPYTGFLDVDAFEKKWSLNAKIYYKLKLNTTGALYKLQQPAF